MKPPKLLCLSCGKPTGRPFSAVTADVCACHPRERSTFEIDVPSLDDLRLTEAAWDTLAALHRENYDDPILVRRAADVSDFIRFYRMSREEREASPDGAKPCFGVTTQLRGDEA